MPTASKLVGALALALTAGVAAWIYAAAEINPKPLGFWFVATNMGVGFFVGWFGIGRRPGSDVVSAMGLGLRGLVFLIIASGMTFAAFTIYDEVDRNKYRDPMELPIAWIQIAIDNVRSAATQDIIIALLVGGILTGLVTYWADRRWS